MDIVHRRLREGLRARGVVRVTGEDAADMALRAIDEARAERDAALGEVASLHSWGRAAEVKRAARAAGQTAPATGLSATLPAETAPVDHPATPGGCARCDGLAAEGVIAGPAVAAPSRGDCVKCAELLEHGRRELAERLDGLAAAGVDQLEASAMAKGYDLAVAELRAVVERPRPACFRTAADHLAVESTRAAALGGDR